MSILRTEASLLRKSVAMFGGVTVLVWILLGLFSEPQRGADLALPPLMTPPHNASDLSEHEEPVSGLKFSVSIAEGLVENPVSGRLLVIISTRANPEPRDAISLPVPGSPRVLGLDLRDLEASQVTVIDTDSESFPIGALERLASGRYVVQAVLMQNQDLLLIDAPGNLSSEPLEVELGPNLEKTIDLSLSRIEPEETLPKDTDLVRYIKLPSAILSEFYGRPFFLRAAVVVPRDFEEDPATKYPLWVNIGGFGSRYTRAGRRMADGSPFRTLWLDQATPRFIMLNLDGAGPLGDPYQVNSANHGPYGDAITQELIPYVEATFRGIGAGYARVLDGGSTGGWVSLALQIFYPEFFNGTWSACPDSVDFRSFQLVNIYEDQNAYKTREGAPRTSFRSRDGTPIYSMQDECQLENALGFGDSWSMSGGQWGSWNATYGPQGPDGRPVPLWDPRTGVINQTVIEHWRKYDLRLILEENWATLGPKLQGKLHLWVGESDNFFLEDAVHRLDDFLANAEPPFEGIIAYGPGEGHCWRGISDAEMLQQMAERVAQGSPH